MPEPASQSASLATAIDATDALPQVRIEVRQGTGRTTSYTIGEGGFLVGTVPGCDLRIPGVDLPPVLCLLAVQAGGVSLRKLAPTQILLINGKTPSTTALQHGDRITLGALDLFVQVQAPPATAKKNPPSAAAGKQDPNLLARGQNLDQRAAELDAREKRLLEQVSELEADRVLWYQRRTEIERECAQGKSNGLPGAARAGGPTSPGQDARVAELDRQKQEVAATRQELADIRKQLYDRYQERRDRLAGLQEAVNRAAQKVQERKRQIDVEAQQAVRERAADAARRAELEAREGELTAANDRLEEERQLQADHLAQRQQELDEKLADRQAREDQLAIQRCELEGKRKQYEADLLRLDRLHGTLEQREKHIQQQAREVEEQLQQLQHDSADLEEQAGQVEEWRGQLKSQEEGLLKQKGEQDALAAQLTQRAAALEGQQATLAALRTRLERMREEVRREEQQLAEQRSRQEVLEAELVEQLQQAEQRRAELDNQQLAHEQQRQQLQERSAVLDAAVSQLRQAQENLSAEEKRSQQRAAELEARAEEQTEQAALVQGRLTQLEETQNRLETERQTLRERTQAVAQAEQARETLQEQLRRRSEELAARQKTLNDEIRRHEAEGQLLQSQRAEWEQQRQHTLEELADRRSHLDEQLQDLQRKEQELQQHLQRKEQELQQREQNFARQFEQLQQTGRKLGQQRKTLMQEREHFQGQKQQVLEAHARAAAEFDGIRRESVELMRQLPDLELRAGTALDRLTHARDLLKDHLGEVHNYAQQCHEELEGVRSQLQSDAERVQRQEQALRRSQDEHRLAMAAFRQQLLDWQGQVTDIKRVLARDETRLERRHAHVDQQERQIDATSDRLVKQAVELHEQERAVVERGVEMERHLVDMRKWYRKKLRELAGTQGQESGIRNQESGVSGGGNTGSEHSQGAVPTILSLTGPLDEADRKLGELLQKLELIDADSLTALLAEARRQRRSLRQVLLASGAVTLYQMALIEAGNVDGLMLGPIRVVDRLRVTPQEAVYRVFDPRRGQEGVLRHLAEAEMRNGGHAGEFRQCFAQATVAHPHLAATWEVVEIAGRPAALQEWLTGLAATDWPPLAAVAGVCFRLVSQAALGLQTIHQAGVVHGHLHEGLIWLTPEGTLKICGLGEPAWLAVPPRNEDAGDASADLLALGKIVAGWCSSSGVRRGAKTKPLPVSLQAVVERLSAESEGYTSAAELLEDLDRISGDIPANAEAWDRLLRHVREYASPAAVLRQSA